MQESEAREEAAADLLRRAMALRKERRIGILWAEQGRFFISESELDPWGTRCPVSVTELKVIVEAAEKKPVQSEVSVKGCKTASKRTR
jgi:hypothetical protein